MTVELGWFDWATREPGPAPRQAYFNKSIIIKAIFHHSLEGFRGAYSALTDPARYPTAWCGTVAFDGTLYQHYPVQAALVASHYGNLFGPAFELEGTQHQPINDAQLTTWQRIHTDLASYTQRAPKRVAGEINLNAIPANELWLLEHRQVGPTACPSERYARLWAEVEDDMVDIEAREQLKQLNDFLVKRERIREVASANGERGDAKMLEAYEALKEKGLVP